MPWAFLSAVLLEPATFENKLVACKSDIPTVGIPKYRSELQMDRIGVALREDQYAQMVLLGQHAKLFRVAIKYRKHHRPVGPVSKSPKSWWNFALRCVVGDIRDRLSRWRWETIRQRRLDRITYLELWQKRMMKKGKALDKADAEALRKLEEWLSYEDIVYFRSLAEVQLRRREQREKENTPTKSGSAAASDSYSSQISSWAGWATGFFKKPPASPASSASSSTSPTADHAVEETSLFGVKLSEDEWAEIYSAVMSDDSLADEHDSDSASGSSTSSTRRADKPPPEWVRIEAAANLKEAQIELRDKKNNPLGCLSLSTVSAKLAIRDAWKTFSAELASLRVTDPSTKGSLFPVLVEPLFEYEARTRPEASASALSSSTKSQSKLFSLSVDLNPQSPAVDYSIDVRLSRLNMIYNYTFIRTVGAFFTTPYDEEAAEEQAQTRGWNLAARRQQLLFLVERKSTVYVNLDVNAPNVLFPQDPTSPSSPMVVLVLGRAQLKTVLAQSAKPEADLSQSVDPASQHNSFYDVFSLSISNVQALMAKTASFDSALRANSEALAPRQLIQPFDFSLELAICKINVEQLANIRLRFALPSLRASLPSRRLRRFMNILFTVISELTGGGGAAVEPVPAGEIESAPEPVIPTLASAAEALEDSKDADAVMPKGTFLDLSLTAPDISMKFSRNEQKKTSNRDIALVKVQGFTTSVRRMEKATVVDISLRNLKIEDLLQDWGPEFSWLADSTIANYEAQSIWRGPADDSSKLIAFHLELLDPSHPAVEQHGTDKFCELKFNSLSVNFNRETWVQFIQFLPNFVGGGDPAPPPAPQAAPMSAVPKELSSLKAQSRLSLRGSAPRRPTSLNLGSPASNPSTRPAARPTDLKKMFVKILYPQSAFSDDFPHFSFVFSTFKMSISVNAIQLSLNDDAKCLSVWALSDSFAQVTTRSSIFTVEGHLGAFKVRDLMSAARYSHVLAIRGNHMVDFKFTMSKSQPGEIGTEPRDVSFLFLQFNSMRLVVNSKFVFDMLRFILVFVSMLGSNAPKPDPVSPEQPLAPKPLPSELDVHAPPAGVFKFHIKLLNPLLTFPENLASSNIIITDLGEIDVQNSFYFIEGDAPAPPIMMEELAVSVRALNAQTGVFKDDFLHPTSRVLFQRALLHNTDLFIHLTRPIRSPAQQADPMLLPLSLPESRIDISVPALKFIANPEQLSLLFNVLRDNWFYMPSDTEAAVARQLNIESEAVRVAAAKKRNSLRGRLLQTTASVLNLEIGLLSLDCRDHCNIFSMQRAPKLCAITIDHTTVAMQTASDESMNLDFEIQSIVFRDIRDDSPFSNIRERKMFVKPLLDENIPQVRGKFVRQENGHQEIQARVDQVRIIAIPPIFSKFSANLFPLVPKLMEVLAKRSNVLERTMTPAQVKKAQDILLLQQKEKKIGFEVKVTLPSAEVYFLEKLGPIATRSVILATSGTIHFKQFGYDQDYEIAFVDLQVFKSSDYASSVIDGGVIQPISESDDSVLLLNPTDLSFTYAARPESVDIHLTTSRTVKLVVSYGDFKLMTMILAQWSSGSEEATAQDQSYRAGTPSSSDASQNDGGASSSDMEDLPDGFELADDDDGITRTSLDLPIPVESPTDPNAAGAKSGAPKPAAAASVARKQRFGMNKSKFDMVVIDDVDGVDTPLFEVKLAITAPVIMTNWSSDFETSMHARGAVDYYNSRLAAWEPLLEPWEFDLAVKGVRWSISSNTLLNLNVTKALINSVRNASKAWSADFYGTQQVPKSPANFPRELIEHRYCTLFLRHLFACCSPHFLFLLWLQTSATTPAFQSLIG